MLARRSPHDAYARVDFDARVVGATPQELVKVCYEQVIGGLGRALLAFERGDNRMKSDALTLATSALTALQLGISGEGGMADALHQLYTAARRAVLDSVVNFDPVKIAAIRADFVEIASALSA